MRSALLLIFAVRFAALASDALPASPAYLSAMREYELTAHEPVAP